MFRSRARQSLGQTQCLGHKERAVGGQPWWIHGTALAHRECRGCRLKRRMCFKVASARHPHAKGYHLHRKAIN